MTAHDITLAVVMQLFPPRRYAVCPNVSWGALPWEADVVAVSQAGIVHEVEVKPGWVKRRNHEPERRITAESIYRLCSLRYWDMVRAR